MPQRVLNFPQMHEGSLTPSDHDILVRVELLAGLAQKDISEIKNSQASYAAATDVRIRALEVALQGKAESIEVEQLQRWKSGMMVGMQWPEAPPEFSVRSWRAICSPLADSLHFPILNRTPEPEPDWT
jgi:hypothetical protein